MILSNKNERIFPYYKKDLAEEHSFKTANDQLDLQQKFPTLEDLTAHMFPAHFKYLKKISAEEHLTFHTAKAAICKSVRRTLDISISVSVFSFYFIQFSVFLV